MTTSVPTAARPRLLTRRVLAWMSWDWGSAGFNAVITTFVFSTYLVSSYFQQPGADPTRAKAQLNSGLGLGIAVAGVVVAVVAPVVGRRSDALGHRRRDLGIVTALLVAVMLAMFLVVGRPPFYLLGVALITVGTVLYDLGTVNYNAMLPGIAPRSAVGRVSALGWASGYFGGIVLLIVVLLLFIGLPTPLLPVTTDEGLNVRLIAVACAVWTAVFAIPVLTRVPEAPAVGGAVNVLRTWADIGRHVARLWRTDRPVVHFLIASAVFRDGLTGVFTFGGPIAASVFGFSSTEVLLFAIAANVAAGVSTVVSGRFDDRFGPKAVVVVSLVGVVVAGLIVFAAHGAGQAVFWSAGLVLCLFVGPAQTASRSILARVTEPEREGELFGLYATTGRAATFLAPVLFSLFTGVTGDSAYGMLAIVIVLAVGLVLVLPVRLARPRTAA